MWFSIFGMIWALFWIFWCAFIDSHMIFRVFCLSVNCLAMILSTINLYQELEIRSADRWLN
jgi:hypothetical protein